MNDRAPRELGRPRRIALQKVLCGLPISAVQNVHPALKTPALRSPNVPSLRDSGHDWAWGNLGFRSLRELHPRLLTAVALRLKSIDAPVLFGGEQLAPVTQTGAPNRLAFAATISTGWTEAGFAAIQSEYFASLPASTQVEPIPHIAPRTQGATL